MGRGKINYELLYKIERKYGGLMNCPEDDKDLQQLRRELNVGQEIRVTRSGSWRDWLKLAERDYSI